MPTCFLFGHHVVCRKIESQLSAIIRQHITQLNVRDFYVGNRGEFDHLAASAVKAAAAVYPDVHLYLVIPYHPAIYKPDLPDFFTGSFYPFETNVPPKYAIARANRFMIGFCDHIITYAEHPGYARDLWEYARRKEKRGGASVVNLGTPFGA